MGSPKKLSFYEDINKSKRNLKIIISAFFLGLIIPILFLIFYALQQVNEQAYFQENASASDLLFQYNQRLADLIQIEDSRSFEDYSFLIIRNQKPTKVVQLSPLSKLKSKNNLEGIIGYFQLSPEGIFSSPVYPEGNVLDEFPQMGISNLELEYRKGIRDEIFRILQTNKVFPSVGPISYSNFLFDHNSYGASVLDPFSNNLTKTMTTDKLHSLEKQNSFGPYSQNLPKVWNPNEVGEVDPMQAQVLRTGELMFFRKIWKDGQRIIQGFLVDRMEFFKSLSKSIFYQSSLSKEYEMVLRHNKNIDLYFPSLEKLKENFQDVIDKNNLTSKFILAQSSLMFPLDSFDILIVSDVLRLGPGFMLVLVLGGVLVIVLFSGLFGIYRLSMSQMNLAKQQQDFVSAVSHELKTPLTSIRMYGEMLRSGWVKDPEKQKSYFDYIFNESERLTRLIGNVLRLSKLSQNVQQTDLVEFTPLMVKKIIESKIASQVSNAGFELSLDFPLEIETRTFLANEDLLTQILINLTDNSLKFSKNSTLKKIELKCFENKKEIIFSIKDYGPGIPKDQTKNIFKLFYRAENELTRTTPGTGIGLALVNNFMEQMNARIILVDSSKGAEFNLNFPLKHNSKT